MKGSVGQKDSAASELACPRKAFHLNLRGVTDWRMRNNSRSARCVKYVNGDLGIFCRYSNF